MESSFIISIVLIFVGLLVFGLSIPLLRGKVRRNKLYGFRTRLTLSSNEVWYPANRFAAKAMIVWAVVTLAIGIVALWLRPTSESALLLLALFPGVGVLIPCGICLWWVRKKFGQAAR